MAAIAIMLIGFFSTGGITGQYGREDVSRVPMRGTSVVDVEYLRPTDIAEGYIGRQNVPREILNEKNGDYNGDGVEFSKDDCIEMANRYSRANKNFLRNPMPEQNYLGGQAGRYFNILDYDLNFDDKFTLWDIMICWNIATKVGPARELGHVGQKAQDCRWEEIGRKVCRFGNLCECEYNEITGVPEYECEVCPGGTECVNKNYNGEYTGVCFERKPLLETY